MPPALRFQLQSRSWHSLAHYSPAVSRCIHRDHLAHLGCVRASMWPRCANLPKSTPFTGLEIPAIAAAGACVITDVIPLNPPPRLDLARGGIHLHAISREAGSHPTRSHERQDLIPHAISREAGSHSRRDSK